MSASIAEPGARKQTVGGAFLIEDARPEDVFTPEDFTDEQRQIAQTTAEFAENSVLPRVSEIEAKDFAVTRALLREAGELGLLAVDVPEQYGGLELGKVTSAIIADHIAVSGSFSVSFSAHCGIGTLPLVWYGTAAQKEKYLGKLASGEWVAAYSLSGVFLRLRRHEHSYPGKALARRKALHPQRREDVDFERRFCRSLYRLRQNRWREVLRFSD